MKALPKIRWPRVTATGWRLAGEVTGLVVMLVGVACWSVGAALVTGGALVVIAIERQG